MYALNNQYCYKSLKVTWDDWYRFGYGYQYGYGNGYGYRYGYDYGSWYGDDNEDEDAIDSNDNNESWNVIGDEESYTATSSTTSNNNANDTTTTTLSTTSNCTYSFFKPVEIPSTYNNLNSMICSTDPSSQICLGDLGGPLVITGDNAHGKDNVQVGIVSCIVDMG